MLTRFIFTLLLCAIVPPAMAAVTFNSSNNQTLTPSIDEDALANSVDADIAGLPDVTGEGMMLDENGFLMGNDPTAFGGQEYEQLVRDKIAKEEKEKTVQIYRGEEANKPKLEPTRTHLMYEQTRY